MKRSLLFAAAVLVQSLLFAQTNKPGYHASTRPFVLGVIDSVQSVQLGEKRILNIYLPPGYNEKDTTRYPVTYLLDGSADEDFIHVAGLFQFNSFEWINRVPKSIVVGIASVDRRRDFTFPSQAPKDLQRNPTSGHSDRFIAFLEKDLQPYIASHYRVSDSKTLIGESLGGLLATEVLFRKPALFNNYIIVSPSLWWNNGSLLNYPVAALQGLAQPTRVYIGVGKEGLTPTDPPRVMEVDANLLAEKIQHLQNDRLRLFFDYLPAEDHATIMHQAVFNGLLWTWRR